MRVGDLDLKCGKCPIIDYCNEFENTPPCAQPRFKNIDTKDYLSVAESGSFVNCKTEDDLVDAIYKALKHKELKEKQ